MSTCAHLSIVFVDAARQKARCTHCGAHFAFNASSGAACSVSQTALYQHQQAQAKHFGVASAPSVRQRSLRAMQAAQENAMLRSQPAPKPASAPWFHETEGEEPGHDAMDVVEEGMQATHASLRQSHTHRSMPDSKSQQMQPQAAQYAPSKDEATSIASVYVNDHLVTMRQRELRESPPGVSQSLWQIRRDGVSALQQCVEAFRLKELTLWTSVRILDEILALQRSGVSLDQCLRLCQACVLLAAKYCEKEVDLPSIEHLARFFRNGMNRDLHMEFEIFILNDVLKWRMGKITPMHFLSYYEMIGIAFSDDTIQTPRGPMPLASQHLPSLVNALATVRRTVLHNPAFYTFQPSVVAASIVGVARNLCGFSDVWRAELQGLTGLQLAVIGDCYNKLGSIFVQDCKPAAIGTPSPQARVRNQYNTPSPQQAPLSRSSYSSFTIA